MSSAAPGQTITTCCIAGGGPAGIMLGYLLARAGIDVCVLEKHGDFLRDFRGDTIHPSTMELLHELGLLQQFLALPHDEVSRVEVSLNGRHFIGPDFSHLPTICKFIAFMPQWDFLNFIAAQAEGFANFHLLRNTAVNGLLFDGERVTGVRATSPDGNIEVRALLTVGADGRDSAVRALAGMVPVDFGVPIDVLWLKLPKRATSPTQALLHIQGGHLFITLDRGDYWQCAFLIAKGSFPNIRAKGLAAFRTLLAETAPVTSAGLVAITDWSQVFLLTVQINRLAHWYRDGLLCIGDAAHAMSPVAGVGINLAIQDAVATANLLSAKLRHGVIVGDDLRAVQNRRERAVRMTQGMQQFVHHRIMVVDKDGRAGIAPPAALQFLAPLFAPVLRRIAARVIGIGFRAEHVAREQAG